MIISIKPGKNNNKNIVYVNNKPIDIGKKLFDLLILLINKNKRKSTRKLINKIKNRHEQHRNETQGDILKVSDEINNFHRNPILSMYHPSNRYNQIEYEIKNQINELNRKLHDNGNKLLENKREPSINWTTHNNDSFEILRKAVRDKDPEAGKLIVEQVPEFKNMMEEVAAIGASGAKKYINHLESEIKHLENTKEKYSEEVDNIYNHIQEKQNKIDELAVNIAHLEQQNYELLADIETKEKQLNDYDNVNDKLYEENETLLKLIESNKTNAEGLRTLYNDEQNKYSLSNKSVTGITFI